MSKLLINEPPLQVLPSLAVAIGLNEALFLQQLHYWLTATARYKPHYREYENVNRPWIYNTYHIKKDEKETGWQANFPFWSVRTIKRIVSSLKEKELIIVTDKFNTASSNRTLWYTIDYDKLVGYEKASTSGTLDSDKLALSGGGQVGTLMTENTTETTTNINDSAKNSQSQSSSIEEANEKLNNFSQEKKADLNTLAHYVADIKTDDITTKDALRAVTLLAYDVAQICKLDIALTGIANLKTIARVTMALNTKNVTADDLKSFSDWWYNEPWQGKNGQAPTPGQIGDMWGQFEAQRVINVPSLDLSGGFHI